MTRIIKLCLAVTLLFGLPSFASNPKGGKRVTSDFLSHLAQEYRQCGKQEAWQRDMKAARYFRKLAKSASKGNMVLPADVNSRQIPTSQLRELNQAKDKLDYQLGLGARDIMPGVAAATQASYECWLQEAEENKHNASIDKEKARFYANLSALSSQALSTIIYFPVDGSQLTSSARSKINGLAGQMKTRGITDVALGTYASSTASSTYNLNLTKRRADSIRKYLRSHGVSQADVIIRTYGEGNLAVPTGDNVENQLNRRAVLSLVKKRP